MSASTLFTCLPCFDQQSFWRCSHFPEWPQNPTNCTPSTFPLSLPLPYSLFLSLPLLPMPSFPFSFPALGPTSGPPPERLNGCAHRRVLRRAFTNKCVLVAGGDLSMMIALLTMSSNVSWDIVSNSSISCSHCATWSMWPRSFVPKIHLERFVQLCQHSMLDKTIT